MDLLQAILQGVIIAATPLAFAAVGEVVAERSGVLNLGVEGMMILGAIAGFAVTLDSGSYVVGVVAAAIAGAAASRSTRASSSMRARRSAFVGRPARSQLPSISALRARL